MAAGRGDRRRGGRRRRGGGSPAGQPDRPAVPRLFFVVIFVSGPIDERLVPGERRHAESGRRRRPRGFHRRQQNVHPAVYPAPPSSCPSLYPSTGTLFPSMALGGSGSSRRVHRDSGCLHRQRREARRLSARRQPLRRGRPQPGRRVGGLPLSPRRRRLPGPRWRLARAAVPARGRGRPPTAAVVGLGRGAAPRVRRRRVRRVVRRPPSSPGRRDCRIRHPDPPGRRAVGAALPAVRRRAGRLDHAHLLAALGRPGRCLCRRRLVRRSSRPGVVAFPGRHGDHRCRRRSAHRRAGACACGLQDRRSTAASTSGPTTRRAPSGAASPGTRPGSTSRRCCVGPWATCR